MMGVGAKRALGLYRSCAPRQRYPVNYLIDREGRLQPAPSTEQPFENLVVAVDALLKQQIIRR